MGSLLLRGFLKKNLKPVFSTLRKQGFENVPYKNDILLLGDSDEHYAQNVKSTSTLLDSLGFTINKFFLLLFLIVFKVGKSS